MDLHRDGLARRDFTVRAVFHSGHIPALLASLRDKRQEPKTQTGQTKEPCEIAVDVWQWLIGACVLVFLLLLQDQGTSCPGIPSAMLTVDLGNFCHRWVVLLAVLTRSQICARVLCVYAFCQECAGKGHNFVFSGLNSSHLESSCVMTYRSLECNVLKFKSDCWHFCWNPYDGFLLL